MPIVRGSDWQIREFASKYPNKENFPQKVYLSLCCTFGIIFLKKNYVMVFVYFVRIEKFETLALMLFFHFSQVSQHPSTLVQDILTRELIWYFLNPGKFFIIVMFKSNGFVFSNDNESQTFQINIFNFHILRHICLLQSPVMSLYLWRTTHKAI